MTPEMVIDPPIPQWIFDRGLSLYGSESRIGTTYTPDGLKVNVFGQPIPEKDEHIESALLRIACERIIALEAKNTDLEAKVEFLGQALNQTIAVLNQLTDKLGGKS